MRDTIIELIFKTFKHSFYLLQIIANNISLETLEDLFQELKWETNCNFAVVSSLVKERHLGLRRQRAPGKEEGGWLILGVCGRRTRSGRLPYDSRKSSLPPSFPAASALFPSSPHAAVPLLVVLTKHQPQTPVISVA